jgi:hypothetical protein
VLKLAENTDNKKDNEIIHIWDKPYRATGLKESPKAFESFIIYRDMGVHRNLQKLAEKLDLKYPCVALWSSKYKWTERINEMNKYKIQEANKLNKEIQRKEIDRINKRLDDKSKLINVLIQVLINNAGKYENQELDFKEFSSMLNLVSRIENMNIADLENIKNLEAMITDDGVDTQGINALVNNFNVLLGANNSDAIDSYQDELKDDEY